MLKSSRSIEPKLGMKIRLLSPLYVETGTITSIDKLEEIIEYTLSGGSIRYTMFTLWYQGKYEILLNNFRLNFIDE